MKRYRVTVRAFGKMVTLSQAEGRGCGPVIRSRPVTVRPAGAIISAQPGFLVGL